MLKTKLILPDGRVISSGNGNEPAILHAKLTQSVNDANELSLGSVCAGLLEVQILDPQCSLKLSQGDMVQALKEDTQGSVFPLGIFLLEKPERSSANVVKLTAYDRVTCLDKDLTTWLASLNGWPYSLLTFATMVAEACGLTVTNTQIPNGEYQVQAFSAFGITGRKLMQWVGELAGRFCRATAEGNLEFAWYTPAETAITPGADRYYFQGGLKYADYQVAPVEKVQLRLTEDDNGVLWPDTPQEKNTYIVQGNYLLTSMDTATLVPVAQTLYAQLKDLSYTPAKVELPAGMDIRAGNSVRITDIKGNTLTTYVMTWVLDGQKQTLESTGSPRRDSSTACNNEEYRVRDSRLLELSKRAEGLEVRASEQREEGNAVAAAVANVQVQAGQLQVQLTQLDSSTGDALRSVEETVQTLKEELALKATPEEVALQICRDREAGAERVITQTGFTFDSDGLTVEKSGTEMKTQITENGMTVYQNETQMLVANNQGVEAKNLNASTFLIVGGRSRFENYGSDRTGCFWIGG